MRDVGFPVTDASFSYDERAHSIEWSADFPNDPAEVDEVAEYGGEPFLNEYYAWEISQGVSGLWLEPDVAGWAPAFTVTINGQRYRCDAALMAGVARTEVDWETWYDRCHTR